MSRPRFTWLGHATVRVDLPTGEVLLINPWVMSNPSCPDFLKQFDRIDAMLLTHGRMDHIDDAVELARRYEPKMVVANHELGTHLEKQGVRNISGMGLGGTQRVLDTQVSMLPAVSGNSVLDAGELRVAGAPCSYVVRLASGYTFYYAGATALFSDMKLIAELHAPSLAFLPIGGWWSMGPREAALACRLLGVSEVVPTQWGTFPALTGTPTQLMDEVGKLGLGAQVIALEPGETY